MARLCVCVCGKAVDVCVCGKAVCVCDNGCVPYLLLVSKPFSMAGPPNNIPLRAKGYLESGIGLISTLTLTRILTLDRKSVV